MTKPTILSIATDVPDYRHEQMEIHDRWLEPYINSRRARAIFSASQIDTRYSVLPTIDFLAGQPGTKARNDIYMKTARTLGMRTIQKALQKADLTPQDVDHFIVVSCTGFDTPGLDVILAHDLGMRSNLRRSALIGMGCQAGLTGLDRALLELTARPTSHVLLLAVEFGSLHFQHGSSLENMIADALFGDGVAAAVVGPGRAEYRPRLINTMTYSDYTLQALMGFHLSDKGYQIHLSTRVSKVLRDIVPEHVDAFLNQCGLSRADVKFWGLHPGGAKIIDYVGEALELTDEALQYPRRVLRQYGNMSSATIFFVLADIIHHGQPSHGDFALLLSFGPGLTMELCLVQWE
ncbi:MAG: type III polyketide synthase [Anaerolineae bacterium]|nr:type III polyketide synthase [Anaerolineae bacterium]